MSKEKKTLQLGMNPSTAQQRLVKDILFKLAKEAGHKCYRCGEELNRETFSIEHKEPWLDSEDPIGIFFDLNNIAFSHLPCNVKASRVSNKVYHTKEDRRLRDNELAKEYDRKPENKEKRKVRRKKRFEETGKW